MASVKPTIFTLRSWKGMPQWCCNLCGWDTLRGEAEMMAHYESAHVPKPIPHTPLVLTADRFGNPVVPPPDLSGETPDGDL